MTLPQTRRVKEYITWYQFTMEKIIELPKLPIGERIGFAFSVLATKHWTSYRALATFALVLDFLFSSLYSLFHAHFFELNNSFMGIFYASTLVFTSLGLEGIKPCTALGEIIVMAEVVSGYLILGLFVFLLTRMVDRKY